MDFSNNYSQKSSSENNFKVNYRNIKKIKKKK